MLHNDFIFVCPPVNKCPECKSVLKLSKCRNNFCYTQTGKKIIVEISRKCRNGNCAIKETDIQFNYFTNAQRFKQYWGTNALGFQRFQTQSPYTNQTVNLPKYLRVGNNYFEWKYLMCLGTVIATGNLSYSQLAKIYICSNIDFPVISQNNLRLETNADLSSKVLSYAHYFWRIANLR